MRYKLFPYLYTAARETYDTGIGMKAEDIPELRRAWCKSHNSHRGLTMSLRELWLNEIVYGPSDGSLCPVRPSRSTRRSS